MALLVPKLIHLWLKIRQNWLLLSAKEMATLLKVGSGGVHQANTSVPLLLSASMNGYGSIFLWLLRRCQVLWLPGESWEGEGQFWGLEFGCMDLLQPPCRLKEIDENKYLPREMGEKSIPGLITILTVHNLLNSLKVAMFYFLPGQTGTNQAFNCGWLITGVMN